eukprot:scaffold582_cov385-Prasinococcus_capsulatus_cf.AAC.2
MPQERSADVVWSAAGGCRAAARTSSAFSETLAPVPLSDEPPQGAPDVVRVQLRVEGQRVVRRFAKSEPARALFKFAALYMKEKGLATPHNGFTLVGALPGEVLRLESLALCPEKTFETEKLGGASFFVRPLLDSQ